MEALKLVLPWLAPADLGNVALTCSAMAACVSTLTRFRLSDATQSMERLPVPFLNSVDECLYAYYQYTPSCKPSAPKNSCFAWGCDGPVQTDGSFEHDLGELQDAGCSCGDDHLDEMTNSSVVCTLDCPCGRTSNGEVAYVNSRLKFSSSEDFTFSVFECGRTCFCSSTSCHNRVSQEGISVKLSVIRDQFKGWCLCAEQDIPLGSFLCEYAGECLTNREAKQRQLIYDAMETRKHRHGSALLVLREYLPSGRSCLRINVDATAIGNVARFINHSCDGGNLFSCLIRKAGSIIPSLGLFARRDISKGEELTICYGKGGRSCLCHCGTSSCQGFLPSEKT